ncbi:hypothetical protein HZH68_016138 [Vespula germanica]|uniref:Reverse transcriptase n=1 Tax=Vespula germanica TaxID=30212 RepID=A0A834J442_VESGE|nr:hypothetical protein HZH68_016138 [Vespula germanica]
MIRGRSQPSHSSKAEKIKTITGRTCDVVEIKIINNKVKTGYIPSLNLGDSIYVDEAIVTNINRRANIKIFNTNEKDTKIKIPTVQLEELEIADKHDVLSLEHDVHMSEMQEFSPSVTSPLAHQLGSAKYLDTFDLASGFYQIPMSEKDAEKPPLLRHTSITNLYEYTLD